MRFWIPVFLSYLKASWGEHQSTGWNTVTNSHNSGQEQVVPHPAGSDMHSQAGMGGCGLHGY